MGLLSFLAKRFVAGETAADAVAAAERMRSRGVRSILDFLGEDVNSEAEARAAVEEYRQLIGLIHQRNSAASISLKVSQMGMLVSPQLCLENLTTVAREAAAWNIGVWIDMEGSHLTQKTIDAFEALRGRTSNVGLCLQAYLVRTGGDLDRLMRQPFKVRLCKGAYKESPSIAYGTKQAVDGSYRMLASKLVEGISRGVYPAFATHDPDLIRDIIQLVRQKGTDPNLFEFEMLYGIQNMTLEGLARQGFRTQVYIPYGRRWLPYFLRRLRERKENIHFLIRNLFRM